MWRVFLWVIKNKNGAAFLSAVFKPKYKQSERKDVYVFIRYSEYYFFYSIFDTYSQ